MKKWQTLKGEIAKLEGAPKQYKQGWTEFYKLKFFLTPDVLIPRPETELLIDEVLSLSPSNLIGNNLVTILDIGTGSGCIAISIAKNLPNAKIIATDISQKALEVAKKNAKFQRVENQIFFLESDLLDFLNNVPRSNRLVYSQKSSAYSKKSSAYNTNIPEIIVANLPYIPTKRLMLIDLMVADFEPRIALDGGIDGFEIYRRLFAQISQKSKVISAGVASLPPPGWDLNLVCEIDDGHGEIALAEASRFFPKARAEVKKDLAKKDRILIVKF